MFAWGLACDMRAPERDALARLSARTSGLSVPSTGTACRASGRSISATSGDAASMSSAFPLVYLDTLCRSPHALSGERNGHMRSFSESSQLQPIAPAPRTSLVDLALPSESKSKPLLSAFPLPEVPETGLELPRHRVVRTRILSRAGRFLFRMLLCGFVVGSLLLAWPGFFNKVGWKDGPRWDSIYQGEKEWRTLPEGSWDSGRAGLPVQDQGRHAMSDKECRFQFPAFYPQLESNVRVWLLKGGMTYSGVRSTSSSLDHGGDADQWGAAHLIVYRNALYIRKVRLGNDSRLPALLSLIHQAIVASPEALPDAEWVVTTADKHGAPGHPGAWTLSGMVSNATKVGQWLAPDFGFAGWPETGIGSMNDYLQLADAVTHSSPWEGRDDRAFWRGYANTYPVRLDLLQRARNDSRTPHPVLNVVETTFHGDKGLAKPVPIHGHCAYRFLLHAEGNSYSGRSKYLFACRSVVIAHPLNWTQHFHPALIPDESSPDRNVVVLPGPNFTGLEATLGALRNNDALAQNIAANSLRIMRHRTYTPYLTLCSKMADIGVHRVPNPGRYELLRPQPHPRVCLNSESDYLACAPPAYY